MTKQTKTKRLTALGVALAVATSMLIGPAAAVENPTRTGIIDAINLMIPTVSEDADKKLSEAAKKLTESLKDQYWSGDELSKEGTKVFEKDRDAVKKLREAITKLTEAGASDEAAAVTVILGDLVSADEKLATDMIAAAVAAKASASKIADAEKEFDKAQEELDKGKPHDAIDHFKKAWEKAFKAEAEATKDAGTASGNGGGSYSEYTFIFRDLNDPDRGAFAVSDSNRAGEYGYTGQGNEGWLLVEARVTSESVSEKMQVHVSCSDAFTDGTGDKSDPTVDSPFRVVSAHIAKYKDGVLDKECDIDGGMAEFGSIDLDKDFSLDGQRTWLPGDVEEHFAGGPVWYQFTIRNTGNVALSNISLTDALYPTQVATCFEQVTLLAGETAECTIGSFPVVDGSNYNVATVTATAASGETVTDTDVAQFFIDFVEG